MSWSFNPVPKNGLGFSRFARRYSGNHFCFLFLQVLRCFSSLGSSLTDYGFICGWQTMMSAGFPHSDICGSSPPNSSPQLFAVWHVLLQFRVARHPPYALPYLISGFLVCFEIILLNIKNCSYCFFLSLSYNFRLRPFLLCLFMLFSFQRSILKDLTISQNQTGNLLQDIRLMYIFLSP